MTEKEERLVAEDHGSALTQTLKEFQSHLSQLSEDCSHTLTEELETSQSIATRLAFVQTIIENDDFSSAADKQINYQGWVDNINKILQTSIDGDSVEDRAKVCDALSFAFSFLPQSLSSNGPIHSIVNKCLMTGLCLFELRVLSQAQFYSIVSTITSAPNIITLDYITEKIVSKFTGPYLNIGRRFNQVFLRSIASIYKGLEDAIASLRELQSYESETIYGKIASGDFPIRSPRLQLFMAFDNDVTMAQETAIRNKLATLIELPNADRTAVLFFVKRYISQIYQKMHTYKVLTTKRLRDICAEVQRPLTIPSEWLTITFGSTDAKAKGDASRSIAMVILESIKELE